MSAPSWPEFTPLVVVAGNPVEVDLSASGSLPIIYSSSGLPAGLSLDANTGLLTGDPTEDAGNYPVVLTATNVDGSLVRILDVMVRVSDVSESESEGLDVGCCPTLVVPVRSVVDRRKITGRCTTYLQLLGLIEVVPIPRPRMTPRNWLLHREPLAAPLPRLESKVYLEGTPPPDRGVFPEWP